VFYVAAALISIYGFIRWRLYRLLKEKEKLEKTVEERTKEIKEKNVQLEAQTVQLTERSEEINEKNKKLESQTNQLTLQSEKLKEMDKIKSHFFANISHEFRTPLTLIMTPLEQIISSPAPIPDKNIFKMMLRNSRRLLNLINQLLAISRFDSGKMKLQATCQNLVPFLRKTLESFHMIALKNKLKLEFQSPEEEIFLFFDSQKMEQVLYNLLINAVKFTPADGQITLSILKKYPVPEQNESPQMIEVPEDYVLISVKDTGIGISKEQLPHIFDRFYQAGESGKSSYEGTGIGLALAKEIVTLHQGKINVHSQVGIGTEFVIHLPRSKEILEEKGLLTPDTPSNDTQKEREFHFTDIDEDEVIFDEPKKEDDIPVIIDDSTGEKSSRDEKNLVLVVEDNVDVRRYIRSNLESLYHVAEAGNGREGIKKAKEIIPDLIISDVMMPEMNGDDMCRELKNDRETSHIPIILLTARASDESILSGLETGANDYITKPFNTVMLLTRVKNLIDLRQQMQQKIQREKMLLPAEIKATSQDETFFKTFISIIEENISEEDFTIDILCERLKMGRSTLFRKIKALTGETPNEFILSFRLERGAQLLKQNYGNVTQVAMAVGFSSSAYFSKCFKEKFHQSPSAFQAAES